MPNDSDFNMGFHVDLSDLNAGINRAKAQIRGFESQVERSARSAASSFTNLRGRVTNLSASFSIVTSGLQQAYSIITQVTTAIVDFTKAADQADKVSRYFDTTMGSLADKGRSWAESLSDSYGLYSVDVENYMATLMDAFQRAGNGLSDSYRMAQDFTQLSYDISVYTPNLSLEEIQEMLLDLARGGGEEALEKLASGFDEDELKARAVALGIADIGEELNVLQKQQAAYDIIMGEYGDIQGLYGETDNATMSMSRLDAATKDLKETLGEVFNPVVEAVGNALAYVVNVLDEFIEKLQEAGRTIRDLFKNGINSIANLFGFGDVFDMNTTTSSMSQATTSTDKLEEALASLNKTAQDVKASMDGLAGFDRLWTVRDTEGDASDSVTDWESAIMEWVAMFATMPEEAVDKLDPMWDAMLEGNYDTVDEFRDQYGDFFQWMVDSELANSDLTNEQKQQAVDELIAYMYGANQRYQEELAQIEQEYQDRKDAYEMGSTEYTLEQIEAMRTASIIQLKDTYETEMGIAYANTMTELGIVSKQEAQQMYDAFMAKVDAIEEAYNTVFDGLHAKLEELNAAIAAAEDRMDSINTGGGYFDNGDQLYGPGGSDWYNDTIAKPLGDIWDRIWPFAEGGLFQPNSPQLVIMGDNKTEPEVAAPRSMIEDAVQNVINRNGGLSGGGGAESIILEVPLQIDGKTFARATYKYIVQEGQRRGMRTLSI